MVGDHRMVKLQIKFTLKTENSPDPQSFAIFNYNYNVQHVVAAGWQLVKSYPLSQRRVTDELHSLAQTDSD